MSQPCSTPKCERTSRAPCDCCNQNLCLLHLYEHNTLLVSQLNPLTDEINILGDRLNTLNFHETARDCRGKLEEWRSDCHQKIDRFFKEKCQELDRLAAAKIDEQRQKILHIQTKLAKLIREQEATRQDIDTLTSTVRELENEINKIDQAGFQVNTHPLLIDDSKVQFKETKSEQQNRDDKQGIISPSSSERRIERNSEKPGNWRTVEKKRRNPPRTDNNRPLQQRSDEPSSSSGAWQSESRMPEETRDNIRSGQNSSNNWRRSNENSNWRTREKTRLNSWRANDSDDENERPSSDNRHTDN